MKADKFKMKVHGISFKSKHLTATPPLTMICMEYTNIVNPMESNTGGQSHQSTLKFMEQFHQANEMQHQREEQVNTCFGWCFTLSWNLELEIDCQEGRHK